VQTIDRAAQTCRDERTARLRQYQERMLGKLLKKYPRKSGEQIARMINAHIADLTDEQLAKIMSPVMVGRAGKDAPKPARE
jgi:hypothetical protein